LHEPRLKSSTEPRACSFAEMTRSPGEPNGGGAPMSIWRPLLIGLMRRSAFFGRRQLRARAFLAVTRVGTGPTAGTANLVLQAEPKRVFPLAAP
jgi:hypothetical protein